MRQLRLSVGIGLFLLLLVLGTYGVAGVIGGLIPSNAGSVRPAQGIPVIIESNGVHTGLVLPKVEYGHDSAGGCSITGGYVYRGTALPELAGHYLYSDYCSGWLKSFTYSNGSASAVTDWAITNVGNILSFGQDAQKELYMLSSSGKVYRIVRK